MNRFGKGECREDLLYVPLVAGDADITNVGQMYVTVAQAFHGLKEQPAFAPRFEGEGLECSYTPRQPVNIPRVGGPGHQVNGSQRLYRSGTAEDGAECLQLPQAGKISVPPRRELCKCRRVRYSIPDQLENRERRHPRCPERLQHVHDLLRGVSDDRQRG